MEAPGQDRMLRQVISLLVLLAGIAERAAERAFPVRILVLVLLRRAEFVARGYAARALLVDVVCYEDDGDVPGAPPGAHALALRFRALAAALRTLLAPDGIPGMGNGCAAAPVRGMARIGSVAGHGRVTPACAMPWPFDTS
jgi:hypothetical protein